MEREGQRGEGAGRTGAHPPAAAVLAGTAVALQLALAAIAATTDARFLVAGGVFLLVPLALALIAPWRAVALAGAVALALTLSAPLWDGGDTLRQYLTRLVIVAIGGPLVVLTARTRDELAAVRSQLSGTRAWLDGVLGSLGEAVTVHDVSGRTVYANAAAARLLGADSPADLLTANPGELAARFSIAGEDGLPVAVEDLPGHRLLAGDPVGPLLTRSVHRATGRRYWLLTKASLLRDATGSYAVNIIEDVTEAKEAELRQRFLDEVGQLLSGSLDFEGTLAQVARLVVPGLADWCAIDVVDERDGLRLVGLAHTDPSKVELGRALRRRRPPDLDAPVGLAAVARGGPAELHAWITDEDLAASIDDPEELEVMRAVGLRSVVIAPLRAGEETFGAITLVSADSCRTFDADDLAFAQDLGLRAGTAILNARLFAEQVRVSHTLQASLLPERLPEVPGWERSAAYRTGEQGAEVGGDFYDIVPTPEGHLVFLGDVTGKGVEAAALTSLVRHTLRVAARFDSRPAAVLRLLNEVLLEQHRVAPVTLVCGLIHAGAGGGVRLTMTAAGHPPPLLKRDREVRELGRHGVLLGAFDDASWEEDTVNVEPGEAIVLYTDGVTDTPGETERFGPERLREVVESAPAAPALLLTAVERALREFQSGPATDDRALLVLRYAGERVPAATAGGSAAGAAGD